MGKSQIYTDTETDSSSVEAIKKKKHSILKYTGTFKKKKCKIHSRSEPEDTDYRAHKTHSNTTNYSGHKKSKLRGILKHGREKEKYYSSSEQEEEDEPKPFYSQDRCLVGRVPHPAGSKPGRGGGLAIIVKKSVKNDENLKQIQQAKRNKSRQVRLMGKRSY